MEVILLKSSACLLAFIAFYKVFLERTSNHQFKRYYLLTVVLISIGIPFITFIEIVEPAFVLGDFGYPTPNAINETLPTGETSNYLPIILWSIYGFGLALLSIRFVFNLVQILLRIRRNPKKRNSNFINVLLQDFITPHTFFNYIFLNKTKFENKEIPKEVILHEETHAKQKHSVDILFIELLQIVFWFNPLVYILKRDIKLNHEFLADQAVIHQGITLTNYQKLLLEFSSNSSSNHLANAINYSLIKKRFTIMKTKTSNQSIGLRSVLLLPLLAILIYGFSTTKQVEKEVIPKVIMKSENAPTKIQALELKQDPSNIVPNGKDSSLKNLKEDFSTEKNSIKSDLKINEVGIADSYVINTTEGNPEKIMLQDGVYIKDKADYVHEQGQKKATPEQVVEYNKLAKRYNNLAKGERIEMKDLKRIKELYNLMSDKQKKNAEPFPNFPPPPPPAAPKVVKGELSNIPPPPPPIPDNATKKQRLKYEKATEDYHKRYEVSKGRVSKRVPPPPIPANASPEEKAKYQKVRLEYEANRKELEVKRRAMINRESSMVEREKEFAAKERELRMVEREKEKELARKEHELRMTQNESKMVARELAMKERQLRMEEKKRTIRKPPIDHVIDMAKKGATFYYNGKKISSDKAISLVKENKNLNISSNTNDGKSTVKISTKGIKLDD